MQGMLLNASASALPEFVLMSVTMMSGDDDKDDEAATATRKVLWRVRSSPQEVDGEVE